MPNDLQNTKIKRTREKKIEIIEIVDKTTGFVHFRAVTQHNQMSDFQVRKLYQQKPNFLKKVH